MGILRHLFFLEIHEILQHFLHHLILAEAVNKIDACFPSSYLDHAVYKVKTLLHLQKPVQVLHVFGKLLSHLLITLRHVF